MKKRTAFLICTALLVMCFELPCCYAQWVTKEPIPAWAPLGSADVVGDTLLYVNEGYTFTYTFLSGWTALSPQPNVNMNRRAMAVASPNEAFFVGGYISPAITKNDVNVFDFQAGWTTKSYLPKSRQGMGLQSYNHDLFGFGGRYDSPTTTVATNDGWKYSYTTDEWTTVASLPFAYAYIGSAGLGAALYVIASTTLLQYRIASDTWTTVQASPTPHRFTFDLPSAIGEHFFVLSDDTAPQTRFERYHILQDTWTSLEDVPRPHYTGSSAMFDSGLLFVIGHLITPTSFATDVHMYTTAFAATVIGDPVFTSFLGRSVLLDMRPGVFSIIQSPALHVTALLEAVDALPAEENMVVTMVGVTILDGTCVLKVDCTAMPGSAFPNCGYNTVPIDCAFPRHVSLSHDYTSLSLSVALLTVVVEAKAIAYDTAAAYFNLRLIASVPPTNLAGILGDLDSMGVESVKDGLRSGAYEVNDGCLHSHFC